jgi:SAM-dependent methyltransferase
MLEQAAKKLAGRVVQGVMRPTVEFLRHQTLPLPFPDSSFDVVCALEVLELFPSMEEPLAEFSRVLRPGGLFLTSRGTEESGRKAKVRSVADLTSLLERNGFQNVRVTKWWKLFDRVLAVKKGSSLPVVSNELRDVLQCPACGKFKWERTLNVLKCRGCGRALSVTNDGIVLT